MSEIQSIGLKVGSQNTALALRNENSKYLQYCDGIDIRTIKTFVKYRKDLRGIDLPPLVGDEAANFANAKQPLNLGVIENEDGVEQTKLILESLNIPQHGNIVLATPAAEIVEGRQRLARAVKETCLPHNNKVNVYSECLCSAVYILKDPKSILTSTFFSVNLGSSTTEFGCFNEGQIEHLSAHSEISGDSADSAINTRVGNVVAGVMLMKKDIRNIKEQASLTDPKSFTVPGFTRNGYVEVQVQDEIIIPLKEYAERVADIVGDEIIGNIDPHIRKIALENPIIFSGGMTNIEGLSELITSNLCDKLNYSIHVKSPTDGNNHLIAAKGALLLCEEIVKEE